MRGKMVTIIGSRTRRSELPRERLGHRPARHDGNDLELDDVGPLDDPSLEQRDVVAFHELKATVETGLDPAADELKPVRGSPALVAELPVHRLRVLIAESLDHHEEHRVSLDVDTREDSPRPEKTQHAGQSSPRVSTTTMRFGTGRSRTRRRCRAHEYFGLSSRRRRAVRVTNGQPLHEGRNTAWALSNTRRALPPTIF